MDVAYKQLNDTFHSVWSLNAELLAKQLDRSLIIVKLREIIADNQSITDDMDAALQRGQCRFQYLIVVLNKSSFPVSF